MKSSKPTKATLLILILRILPHDRENSCIGNLSSEHWNTNRQKYKKEGERSACSFIPPLHALQFEQCSLFQGSI